MKKLYKLKDNYIVTENVLEGEEIATYPFDLKEIFIKFLKDNDFYEGWMEGYKLDNKIHNDDLPLDHFFENINSDLWLYSGPEALATLYFRPNDKELLKQYNDWRKKYSSLYSKLDEEWMKLEHAVWDS